MNGIPDEQVPYPERELSTVEEGNKHKRNKKYKECRMELRAKGWAKAKNYEVNKVSEGSIHKIYR